LLRSKETPLLLMIERHLNRTGRTLVKRPKESRRHRWPALHVDGPRG
jgi:hypothetical protein